MLFRSVLQDLVRANRLHISRTVTVIARTAEVEGAPAALRLGDVAASFTSNDDLLKQLIAIAKASGDATALEKWTLRQQAAAAARAQLARRAPGG